MISRKKDHLLLGVLFMLAACFVFSTMDTAAKYLTGFFPPLMIVWMRYVINFAVVSTISVARQGHVPWRTEWPKLHLLRSAFLLLGTTCNFISLEFLPLTTALTIMFLGPLLVTILSVPILGEKVGPRRILAVIIGFIGVLIVLKPGHDMQLIMLVQLLASCGFAGYSLTSRILAGYDDAETSNFYAPMFGSIAFFPVIFFVWETPDSLFHWILLLSLGGVGATIGHHFMISAHRYAHAVVLSPFFYTTLLWAVLFSWLLFDQLPDESVIIGATLIIGSGIYTTQREYRSQKLAA